MSGLQELKERSVISTNKRIVVNKMDLDQLSLPSEDLIYNWIDSGASDYAVREQILKWLDRLFKSANNSNEQISSLEERIEELESKLADEIDNPPHPKFGWSKSV